jgi:undecaprenyl-diphosphatase
MLETIHKIDTALLLLINGAHNTFLDVIMFRISDKLMWTPFYAWLLFILYKKYGGKILWILLAVVVLITSSDQLSVMAKNYFQELRPCHEPSLASVIHLVNNSCGGMYGYVSSHAANSMGLAVFVYLLLPGYNKIISYALAFYVLLTGYSRIYLAAHYPFDVLRGWLLGLLLGIIIGKLLQWVFLKINKTTLHHE